MLLELKSLNKSIVGQYKKGLEILNLNFSILTTMHVKIGKITIYL